MPSAQSSAVHTPERVELILSQLDQLPTLPVVAVRVLEVTAREGTSANDLIRVISSDQSLSTKILSLAAKASLGVGRKADTIEKAVVLLGFDAIRHAVLSIKVFETFSGTGTASAGHFDRDAFWKHCLAVACAAHLIAERWPGHVDPEVAFVCGLLHDLGKVALSTCLPKSYDRVANLARSRHVSIIEVEQEVLGVDHTVVGKRLAHRWNLPAALAECIWLHHHTPEMIPDGVSNPDVVRIVNLSDTWVREQGLGFAGLPADGPTSAEIAEQMCFPAEHFASLAPLLFERVEQRAQLIGLNELTSADIYTEAIAGLNSALGQVVARLAGAHRQLENRSRGLEMIHRLTSAVHSHSSLRDICRVAAGCFRDFSGVDKIGVFARPAGGEVCHLGWAHDQDDGAEAFAWPSDGSDAARDTPVSGPPVLSMAPSHVVVVQDRLGTRIGPAPHWMLPLVKDGEQWGGILFRAETDVIARLRQQMNELTVFAEALANMIVGGYDRLRLDGLNEGLADVNRRLKVAQKKLCRARSLEMVAEMAAGAAHELNNPLAVVSGRAELLVRQVADGRTKKGLEIIIEQTHRCSGIVSELMEFAKPDPPQVERVNLSALLQNLTCKWIQQSSLAPEQLTVAISDADNSIDADLDQLGRMFDELLKNALAACGPDRARVHINCTTDVADEQAVVTIEDNGCGMDAEVLEKAGDPFFSHRQSGRGRGLGLSRASRWCEINGGRLRLESRPGEGTKVWITFPLSAAVQD